MPRQRVYGKRSRAGLDTFANFVSSPRKPVDEPIEVLEVAEELSRLVVDDGDRVTSRRNGRRALGEKNVNAAVQVEALDGRRETRRTRGKRAVKTVGKEKIVTQEEPSEAPEVAKTDQETTPCNVAQRERDWNEIDDVPLFFDDHGYNTEDEMPKAVDEPVTDTEEDENEHNTHAGEVEDEQQVTPKQKTPIALPSSPPTLDEYTEHCLPLVQLSPHPITDFSEWSDQISLHFNLTKIAEASFAEVYRFSLISPLPGIANTDESVFKIIALKAPTSTLPTSKRALDAALQKSEAMSAPADVASEVHLLQRMASIPGFTNFRDLRIVRGRPPKPFAQAFKAYNAAQKAAGKDLSVFPDPARKTSYAPDQLWAVIEMQDAGADLERCVETGACASIWTTWDVFWQVVLALAKGEEGAEFEHRDLHLGNICVRNAAPPPPPSKNSSPADPYPDIDVTRTLHFTPVETTLIDYTISRCLLNEPADDPDATTTPQRPAVAYHDLSLDPALFEADSTSEYQYDIYRYMRGAALYNDPYHTPSASDPTPPPSWRTHTPTTNLVWLHFVLYKLLEQLDWPSASRPPARKRQPERFAQWKRANDLEFVLLRVQDLLDPGVICGEGRLGGAKGLVALAVGEGWLGWGDVVGGEGGRERKKRSRGVRVRGLWGR